MLEGGQPEKPAILVLSAASSRIENEVLAGIEEEGVPYVLEHADGGIADDATVLARIATNNSSLDVGIGVDRHDRVCILHEKLTELLAGLSTSVAASPSVARAAGHNAARIVVGIPLRDLGC